MNGSKQSSSQSSATENRRLAGLIPGARYEEIANARHFPNVEHPDRFNHIMLSWLQLNRHDGA